MSVDAVVHRVSSRYREQLGAAETSVALEQLLAEEAPLLGPADRERALGLLRAQLSGLGPLEQFCADAAVTDILVNGPGPVWVERRGVLSPTAVELSRDEINLIIERILGPLGLRIDRAHPIADGRLADGSRVSAVGPPIALEGPVVAIRRFGARVPALEEFTTTEVIGLLDEMLDRRLNVVIFGGTGAGKTSLLNALASRLPARERILTIEEAAELRLPGEHVVRLETRPANAEGVGEVTIRQLVRSALRLRPDRIVVGEVRGPEALDMVWAMATGHDGSLSTLHASSAADAVQRLETFLLMAGEDLPLPAVRTQIGTAVDALVGVRRCADGSRRIDVIVELPPGSDDPRPNVVVRGSDLVGALHRDRRGHR
jgi:pilus assembly protein CpaF